jgi:septal ring factor EnvC (AmiA/AmiB activator)
LNLLLGIEDLKRVRKSLQTSIASDESRQHEIEHQVKLLHEQLAEITHQVKHKRHQLGQVEDVLSQSEQAFKQVRFVL